MTEFFKTREAIFSLEHLSTNSIKLFNSTESRRVYLCLHKINSSSVNPYLSYLLKKTEQKEKVVTLQLPFHDVTKDVTIYTHEELLSMIDICIKLLLCNHSCEFEKILYRGCMLWTKNKNKEKDLYLFYDFTYCNLRLQSVNCQDPLWFGLVDEIANLKHICNIPIQPDVTDFFLTNSRLIQLKDRENNNLTIDTPVVVYAEVDYSRVNYVFVFGFKNKVFTDFSNASKKALLTKSGTSPGGLVRFALFMSSTKIDIWTNEKTNWRDGFEFALGTEYYDYDSIIYTGVEDNVAFVIKDSRQQLPLSYHYVQRENAIL